MPDIDVIERPESKTVVAKPPRWKVLQINELGAVVMCTLPALVETFKLSVGEASQIALFAAFHGSAIITTGTKDLAETKAAKANEAHTSKSGGCGICLQISYVAEPV